MNQPVLNTCIGCLLSIEIEMKTLIRSLINGLLIFTVTALLPFAWILRDGLGPNATTSEGMHAVSRFFMTFYSGPTLLVLIVLAVICYRADRADRPCADA